MAIFCKFGLKKTFFVFYFLCIIFFLFFLKSALSITMRSTSYRVEESNVNIGAANQKSYTYDLSSTLGQTAAGKFVSNGYIVKAGFQYIHSTIPFSFSISDISINFGNVIPNTPVTQTTELTVSFGSAGEYQITAQENGPLSLPDKSATIPDTSCNGGSETCTEYTAAVWDSNTAYGFGYNMSGNDIPADFVNSSYYRRFPDKSANENPAIVMSSKNVGIERKATVTFKLNVSPTQQGGVYDTVINFIATPSF